MGLTPAEGGPDWEIEGWITSCVAVTNGDLAEPTTTVRDLTGHDPQRLDAFLEQHPETYAHLVARS